jgi:hypothetical protein
MNRLEGLLWLTRKPGSDSWVIPWSACVSGPLDFKGSKDEPSIRQAATAWTIAFAAWKGRRKVLGRDLSQQFLLHV